MTEPTRDPPSRFEDEGIPDLQQVTGESFDEKLTREEPAEQPGSAEPTAPDGLAYGDDVQDVDVAAGELVPSEEAIGPAGRLVELDEGKDREKDAVAGDVGPDSGGLSPEEHAMRIEPER